MPELTLKVGGDSAEATAALKQVTAALSGMAGASTKAAAEVADAGAEAGKSAKQIEGVSQAAKAADAALEQVADAAKEASGKLDAVGAEGREAGAGLKQTGAGGTAARAGLTEVTAALNRVAGALEKTTAEAKVTGEELENTGKKGKDALEKLSRRSADLEQGVRQVALGVGSIFAPMGLATKQAVDFDAALRNVDSIAKLTPAALEKLRGEVLALTKDPSITQGPTQLAEGLYQIQSSGFSGQEALEALRSSAITATAGLTTTAVSARVLTGVMNSGVRGVKTFREASDVLFATVDKGVVSFEELANELGPTLPLAAQAGVSIQELGAAFAVMTRNGISASESATAVRGLLTQIVSPSQEATKALGEHAGILTIANLRAVGLSGVMQQLNQAFKGNTDELVHIIPEVRALMAAFSLAQNGGRDYTEMLGEMARATEGAGATQSALDRQLESSQAKWDKLRAQLERLGIELGTKVLPRLNELLGWANQHPEMAAMAVQVAALAFGVTQLAQAAASLKATGFFTAVARINPVVAGLAAAAVTLGYVIHEDTKRNQTTRRLPNEGASDIQSRLHGGDLSGDQQFRGEEFEARRIRDFEAEFERKHKRRPTNREIGDFMRGAGLVLGTGPGNSSNPRRANGVPILPSTGVDSSGGGLGNSAGTPGLPTSAPALTEAERRKATAEAQRLAEARKALAAAVARIGVDARPEDTIAQRRNKDLADLRLQEQQKKDEIVSLAKAARTAVPAEAIADIEATFLDLRKKRWYAAEAELKALREKANSDAYEAANQALGHATAQVERGLEQRRRALEAEGKSEQEIALRIAQARIDAFQSIQGRDDESVFLPGAKKLPPSLREDKVNQPLAAAQRDLLRLQQQALKALETEEQRLAETQERSLGERAKRLAEIKGLQEAILETEFRNALAEAALAGDQERQLALLDERLHVLTEERDAQGRTLAERKTALELDARINELLQRRKAITDELARNEERAAAALKEVAGITSGAAQGAVERYGAGKAALQTRLDDARLSDEERERRRLREEAAKALFGDGSTYAGLSEAGRFAADTWVSEFMDATREQVFPRWQSLWRDLGQFAADGLKSTLGNAIEDALMGDFSAKRLGEELRRVLARTVATAATEGISAQLSQFFRKRPAKGQESASDAAASLPAAGDGENPVGKVAGIAGVVGGIKKHGAQVAVALAGITQIFTQGKSKLANVLTGLIQVLGAIPVGGGGNLLGSVIGGIASVFGFDTPVKDSLARGMGFEAMAGVSRPQVGRWGFDFANAFRQGAGDVLASGRGTGSGSQEAASGSGGSKPTQPVTVHVTQNIARMDSRADVDRSYEDLGWVLQRRMRTA